MRVDFVGALFVASVVMSSVSLSQSGCKSHVANLYHVVTVYTVCHTTVSIFSPSTIGLAVTYTVSLSGMMQYCMRQSAEIESIVSID